MGGELVRLGGQEVEQKEGVGFLVQEDESGWQSVQQVKFAGDEDEAEDAEDWVGISWTRGRSTQVGENVIGEGAGEVYEPDFVWKLLGEMEGGRLGALGELYDLDQQAVYRNFGEVVRIAGGYLDEAAVRREMAEEWSVGAIFDLTVKQEGKQRERMGELMQFVVENGLKVPEWMAERYMDFVLAEASSVGVRRLPKRQQFYEKLGVQLPEHLEELAELKEMSVRPEYRNTYVGWDTAPEEAREEHEVALGAIEGREDKRKMDKILEGFYPERWRRMDEGRRRAQVADYAKMLGQSFGLMIPCKLSFEDLNEGDRDGEKIRTTGRCRSRWWPLAEGCEMQDVLQKAGKDLHWTVGAEIVVDRGAMRDGVQVTQVVAHEMWHAYQRQQRFLNEQGCFGKGVELGDTVVKTPLLGERYTATAQAGSYVDAKDDYDAYRKQIIEDEAFEVGGLYKERMLKRRRRGVIEKAKEKMMDFVAGLMKVDEAR